MPYSCNYNSIFIYPSNLTRETSTIICEINGVVIESLTKRIGEHSLNVEMTEEFDVTFKNAKQDENNKRYLVDLVYSDVSTYETSTYETK